MTSTVPSSRQDGFVHIASRKAVWLSRVFLELHDMDNDTKTEDRHSSTNVIPTSMSIAGSGDEVRTARHKGKPMWGTAMLPIGTSHRDRDSRAERRAHGQQNSGVEQDRRMSTSRKFMAVPRQWI